MASATVVRAVFTAELLSFRPISQTSGPLGFSRRKSVTSSSSRKSVTSSSSSSCGFWTRNGTGEFPTWKPTAGSRCLGYGGDKNPEDDQGPPQEAVLKAISEVSKAEGRVGQTTNMVIGGTVTDDSTNEWVALDQKVNSYPTVRGFTAIGTGGDDFVQAMVVAVESVIQEPIPEGRVRQKVSARGKYVSVNIGPVQVFSSEQVQAVYNAMRSDNRMKYFL